MRFSAIFWRFVLVLLLLAIFSSLGAAQEELASPTPQASPVGADRLDSLRSIKQSIDLLEEELKQKQRSLRSPEAEGQREQLTDEIQQIAEQLRDLRQNFKEIASGVDLELFSDEPPTSEISWSKELKELISPVLNELKDITSTPREIDRLQTEIADYQQKIAVATDAIDNLRSLLEKVDKRDLERSLNKTIEEWQGQQQAYKTQLAINAQKLEQRLGERKSFSEALEQLFEVFFKRRGRNLLVALFATLMFWLGIRRLYSGIEKVSPLHKKRQSFTARLFNVFYLALTIVGTALVFLMVLYFFGDWVLLILAVMMMVGLVWASKQAIPRSWGQATLLLNLGPVREHERLEYNGLPWLVKKINFYTMLENPELTGGSIRLPINDLTDLRSRPFDPAEPWFPTHAQDWVILGDGTFGRVVFQSPEIVRLVELGGAQKTYPAGEFLNCTPKVLTRGFRIQLSFGIDYQHQEFICDAIPEQLETELRKRLAALDYSKDSLKLSVEFEEAGASSLNLAVIADFKGDHASNYLRLRRTLQRLCVECCNEFGWVIPFEQLTLHVAEVPESSGQNTLSA